VEHAAEPAGARLGEAPSPIGELLHTESTAYHCRGPMVERLAGVDEDETKEQLRLIPCAKTMMRSSGGKGTATSYPGRRPPVRRKF
jgi:hypothetical protein